MKNYVFILSFMLAAIFSAGLAAADSGQGNNTGDDSFIIGKKLNIDLEDLAENGFDPARGAFELKLVSYELSRDYTDHTVAKYENGALVIVDNHLPAPRYLDEFGPSRQQPGCEYSNTDGIKAAWGNFYVKFNDKTFTLGSFSPHDPPGYLYLTGPVTETCKGTARQYQKGWNRSGGPIAEIPLSLTPSMF